MIEERQYEALEGLSSEKSRMRKISIDLLIGVGRLEKHFWYTLKPVSVQSMTQKKKKNIALDYKLSIILVHSGTN